MDYKTAKGWLRDEERDWLFAVAKQANTILNVGVEMGASVVALHEGDGTAYLEAIDIDLSNIDPVLRSTYEGEGVRFIEDNSHTFNFYNPDSVMYDLIFIDGDHSYEGVKADIANILPHLSTEGIVAFHDCYDFANPTIVHRVCPGVNKAVTEWFSTAQGEFVEMQGVGTMRIFKCVEGGA